MSNNMWSRGFWKGTAERVIASTAGGALAVLGTDLFNVADLDGRAVLGVALGAGLVSLLKALAAGAANGTPSVASVETPSEAVVEKQVGTAVVAGPANDQVTPGAVVRATSPPSAKHHSDTADRLDP